jgi:glutamine synthetase
MVESCSRRSRWPAAPRSCPSRCLAIYGTVWSKLNESKPLRDVLGDRFVDTIWYVKRAEYDAYQRVISSWERENLLLNV